MSVDTSAEAVERWAFDAMDAGHIELAALLRALVAERDALNASVRSREATAENRGAAEMRERCITEILASLMEGGDQHVVVAAIRALPLRSPPAP